MWKRVSIIAVIVLLPVCMWGATINVDNGETTVQPKKKIVLPAPNFNGQYQECNKNGRTTLKFISKSANKIVNDFEWIEKYSKGMKSAETYMFTPGGRRATVDLQNRVPVVYDGLYRRSVDVFDGYNVIYYGKKMSNRDFGIDPTLILVTNSSFDDVRCVIDFSKFSVSGFSTLEDIEYTAISVSNVQIENDILYACVSHSTYSASSAGYNAYLVAVDLRAQTLKWMTKPLTCKSDFIIYNDVIFTGYGYTAEKDYIYVIDKETGDRISCTSIEKAPSYFSVIGDKLYVRTYSLDYTFQIIE